MKRTNHLTQENGKNSLQLCYPLIQLLMSKIYKSLPAIFNVASRRKIFKAMQRDFYPKEHIMAVSSLTNIRWAYKFEGVNTIVRRFQAILQSLQKISATNSSQADSAAGLYHKILLGKFVICLCFVHKVLSILYGLSKLLERIESGLLKTECRRAKILIEAGKNVDPNLYLYLFKLIKISKTLPVGTATIERSFNAMNRIFSWARNSLDYSLTSDFMILFMNKDILKFNELGQST